MREPNSRERASGPVVVGLALITFGLAGLGFLFGAMLGPVGSGNEPEARNLPTPSPTPPMTTAEVPLPSPTPASTQQPVPSPSPPPQETLGPGVTSPLRLGAAVCKQLWQSALTNVYPPDSPRLVESLADVTADGDPERFSSVLTSMTGNSVVIQDSKGRFLFCDRGDRLKLSPLEADGGFIESFFMQGDNAHCCPEGEVKIAYAWAGNRFQPEWGMVQDLPDSDSVQDFPAGWECTFGPCPEEEPPALPDEDLAQLPFDEMQDPAPEQGLPTVGAGSCLNEVGAPAIDGSSTFWERTSQALALLPPDYYSIVVCWLQTIRQDTGKSRVNVVDGTFFVNDVLAFGLDASESYVSEVYYASSLVHDAVHVREYWQGRPSYGRDGELTALHVQLEVLQALAAPPSMVDCTQQIVDNIDDPAYQYWNGATPPCTYVATTQ